MSYLDIWRKHAVLREGRVAHVYLDTEGFKTAGIGHLLTPEEAEKYNVGDKVTQEQIDDWFKADTQHAEFAALRQAKEIGCKQDWFIAALISVNFQLGNNWTKKFFTTYPAIVAGDFDKAIENISRSKWYRQTPVRAEDFIYALERLKEFRARPLKKTRSMVGAGTAGVSIAASEIAEVTEKIEPLTGYSDIIQTVFIVLALAGIGLAIYARIDDRNKGKR